VEYLIPTDWFKDLPQWGLLGLVAVSLYTLMNGADWLVEGASGLARRFGVPEIIVGATIVSLGTTAPECAVSVMAAWDGKSGLALGNAVGSIIADTGLIFGLGCLLTVLPVNRFLLSRQGWVQFGSAVLLAGLCYGSWFVRGSSAVLPFWVGGLFLALLAVYMVVSVGWSRQAGAMDAGALPVAVDVAAESGPKPKLPRLQQEDARSQDVAEQVTTGSEAQPDPDSDGPSRLLILLLLGAAIVVGSSHVLIESVTVLAVRLSIPQVVISATLVAFGTSLPELVVGMTAIRRGHPELLVGNVIGADVLNVLFVIGASAIASPLPIVDSGARIPEIFLIVHLPTMLTILILFRLFIFRAVRRDAFERWMGGPLVLLYVAYVVVQFVIGVGGQSPPIVS